ncbi:anaphase-promoting complex subunit 4 [Thermosporothrix hazakensis]|jgi:serine/threonine protein kinase|uniref:non-specific serine/threonine protein kinase n=1 Tax=Thermosporothrix hazakensis TaxID=644383 RepID=A0A326UAJ4_THEHA|nr:WD40 repeat domain-containing serine/threonine protein kinase [Thermosporothrix hazakensis]PZW32842.1 anaphase-promoting complex subunit 4 [Thermosporothrix hazakensis]GCE48873.1 hypothetical protein KTH_37420 [Thermosporothrix hazakensis]
MNEPECYCQICGAANAANVERCFACAQLLRGEAERLLQQRYRLLEQIGSGGFGAVYKVADTRMHGTIRALKQVNLRGLTPEQAIEATDAFHREVQILSLLRHPHVPRLYDHFYDAEHWYLVLEYIQGETLEHYLERKRPLQAFAPFLPLPEILDIALQVCEVLEYLHARQPAIVYRDLKPSNIMLTRDGHLYLIDFGIARRYRPGQEKDTIPFGSPGYAAPEQYGKVQTTPASDIYSLGALLHFLLSGDDPAEHPFQFTPLRLEQMQRLASLVMQMVELEVQRRPQQIADVRAQLLYCSDHALFALPSQRRALLSGSFSSPIGSGKQVQQLVYPSALAASTQAKIKVLCRRLIIRGVLAGTAVALLASSLGSSWFQLPIIPQQNDAGKTLYLNMALAPGGSYLAYSTDMGEVILKDFRSEWEHVLFAERYFLLSALNWSADGRSLASANTGGYVSIWEAATGRQLAYYQARVDGRSEEMRTLLAWAPENTMLAAAHLLDKSLKLCVWNIKRQEVTVLLEGTEASELVALDWSPDSSQLALGYRNGLVRLLDVASKTIVASWHTINDPASQSVLRAIRWSPEGRYLAVMGPEQALALWNVHTGVRSLGIMPGVIDGSLLLWSANGRYLAAVFLPDYLLLWDTASGLTFQTRRVPGLQAIALGKGTDELLLMYKTLQLERWKYV